jgi:tRNA threonylcarbamoyladenosine biosynthesis protein TsaB
LYRDGIVDADHRIIPREHNQRVLGMADKLLRAAGLAPDALDAVAFGRGPGSFTGLRIAAGIAQGMALGLGVPVVPVSTLEVLAATAATIRPEAPGIVSVLKSRVGEVYLGVYTIVRTGGEPVPRALVPEAGIVVSALALPDAVGTDWVFCGDGVDAVAKAIDRHFGIGVRLHPELLPNAGALVRIAAKRLERGDGVDAADAIPEYLQAELPWRKSGA